MWHTIHLSFLIVRPRSLSHRPSHLEVHIAETQWKHQDHSRICQHVQIDPLLINQWTAEGFFSQSCWSDEFFSGRAVNSTSGLFEDGSWSKDHNKMVKEEMPANFSTPRYIINSGSWCVIPIPICAGWSDEHCTCSTTRKSPRCKKVNQGKKNLKGGFFITQKNYAEKKIYNIYIGRQKKKNVGENKNSIWILAKVCNCQWTVHHLGLVTIWCQQWMDKNWKEL